MPLLEIGRKYGKLTATAQHNKKECDFKCDCGNLTTKNASSVKGGLTKSCGCLAKESGWVDLTGRRYGMLVIREPVTWPDWLCDCDCGGTIVVSKRKLFKRWVTNCGCQKEKPLSKKVFYGGDQRKYQRFKFDWHVFQGDTLMKMRSSYEVIYAQWLIRNKIDFVYEPQRFKLEGGDYIPDFYLPEFDRYVELKGIMTVESAARIQRFREITGNELQIIGEDEINDYLPEGVNYNRFLRDWKKDQAARGCAPPAVKKVREFREVTPSIQKAMTKSLPFNLKEIEAIVGFRQQSKR